MDHSIRALLGAISLSVILAASPAAAADDSHKLPYWAALRSDTVNMRVGPGEDYRIAWVFHREHLPMKVLRAREAWRLVQDASGARGWIMLRFLSHERAGFIIGKGPATMREGTTADSRMLWRLSPGVLGRLGDCAQGWCRLDIAGHAGFVEQARLWGAGEP